MDRSRRARLALVTAPVQIVTSTVIAVTVVTGLLVAEIDIRLALGAQLLLSVAAIWFYCGRDSAAIERPPLQSRPRHAARFPGSTQ